MTSSLPRFLEEALQSGPSPRLESDDFVGSNLVGEVSRKREKKQADEDPIFCFQISYSGGGVAGVADARIVRTESVEAFQGTLHCCMRPAIQVITESSEIAILAAGPRGHTFGQVTCFSDTCFEVCGMFRSCVVSKCDLEFVHQFCKVFVSLIDSLQVMVEARENSRQDNAKLEGIIDPVM